MIYQDGNLQLNCIQIIKDNAVNKICVCENVSDKLNTKYVTVELKNHEISKQVVRVFFGKDVPQYSQSNYISESNGGILRFFSNEGRIVLLFPYSMPRPITDFYVGEVLSLSTCEEICSNILISCIQSGIPFQVLYLMLKQGLLNLNQDNSVYFNYCIDFSEIDENIGQRECVVETAKLLLWILEAHSSERAISYELLQKRVASSGYSKYTELYKDVTMASTPHFKGNFITRFIDFFKNNKDPLFKVLLVVCVTLFVLMIASLVTQMIFGDVPWLRLFFGQFKHIGTESLLQ